MQASQTSEVPAAVLVPLLRIDGDRLEVLLTRRRDDLPAHAGEISFPGGRWEQGDRDLRQTALREAQEEIGLSPAEVSVLGQLPQVRTFVTNYLITPFAGLLGDQPALRASPREVHALLRVSLEELSRSCHRRTLERSGRMTETDAFMADGHLVWGATARILVSLFEWLDLHDPVSTGTPTRLPHSVQEPS